MQEPPELVHNAHWREAVWALRAGYLSLVIAAAGLVLTLSGWTPWVLAIGMIGWLGAAVFTVLGVAEAREELPEPRPSFWKMRLMLIHDTVHAVR